MATQMDVVACARRAASSTLIVSTVDSLSTFPVPTTSDSPMALEFRAEPGLYQFSAVFDAEDFDWQHLYEMLNKYGNSGERTGPWDFSINFAGTPLLPSFWVRVNGQTVGLWFMQRVSLEDLQNRRFRGRTAFFADGRTRLEIIPYRGVLLDGNASSPAEERPALDWSGIRWLGGLIERDPEDCLAPLPAGIRDGHASPAARMGSAGFWEALRERLRGASSCYREPLDRAAAYLMARESCGPDEFLALVALERLGVAPGAMAKALAVIEDLLGRRAWGNPDPASYMHNGDMAVMSALRAFAWAWHAIPDELGADRHSQVLARLCRQGDLFLDLALLNRDYWGGSVVQDHGWRSMFGFGAVTLYMLGVAQPAERWAKYAFPRLRRSLAAMPRDGAMPLSTHRRLFSYMHEVTQYRDALVAATGEDLFDQPQFPPILDYLASLLTPFVEGNESRTASHCHVLWGANHFLNRMAAKLPSGTAASLESLLRAPRKYAFAPRAYESRYYVGIVEGFLSHEPTSPSPAWPAPVPLTHFEDSGEIIYRDKTAQLILQLQCGPDSGYNSYWRATGPCDRLGSSPGAGHFAITVEGISLLGAKPGGYRLHSVQRSCMLIDGKGQHGDIGYPMSIPSKRHRGEHIEHVRWNGETGWIRLNLEPAYPAEAGVIRYSRDFILEPARIVVRDTTVLARPAVLSWLFQGESGQDVSLENHIAAVFGRGPALHLAVHGSTLPLQASVHETPVVWSYDGKQPAVHHARYDGKHAVQSACVEFIIALDEE